MNQSSCIEDMLSMKDDVTESSEVIELFNDRNVLITGGSGFIGKLLIHKLLRLCPKLGKLFILMRPKKGKMPSERLKEIFEDPLYEKLHEEQPNFINRIILIEADTSESDLGLSSSDRDFIIENTDVVIHGAATVRFDDNLRTVIKINVTGVKVLLELARKMPRLKAFVHISTAFSHFHRKSIEEKYYDPPLNIDKALALIEVLDDDTLELITPKIVGKFRNTYVFSKALSEEVVRVYGTGLPVCIVRPSIITSTMHEPIRGWIDNIYGVTGITLFVYYLAMFRTMILDKSKVAEMIPADYVVNNVVVAAWDINKRWEVAPDTIADEPPIYNCVTSCQNPLTWGEYIKLISTRSSEVISSKAMWYCVFFPTRYKLLHYIYMFFLHWVPAVIIDTFSRLLGQKAKLYDTTKKVQKFSDAVAFICTHNWRYDNRNVMSLWDKMNSTDKKLFDFNVQNLDWREFIIFYSRGIRTYLLKDPMSNLEASITRYRRLKLAHFTLVGILSVILFWIVVWCIRI